MADVFVDLDFVRPGVLRYGTVAMTNIGKMPTETKEEAVERLVTAITSGKTLNEIYDSISLALLPYGAESLSDVGFRYRNEDKGVRMEVRERLLKRQAELAPQVKSEEKEKVVAKEAEERKQYIEKIAAKRKVLEEDAKEAGFGSLLEYLMFLELCETEKISGMKKENM